MIAIWLLVIRPYHVPMLPEGKEPLLRQLIDLFLKENEVTNLSALRDPEAAWVGHIIDSIALLDILPFLKEKLGTQNVVKLLDIGTGGGFPLLPLAISLPETQFLGLDATGKKIKAIERMKDKLGLTNIKLIAGRAEDVAHEEPLRETFDIVTSRAVAEIPVLLEYAVPFLRKGGCVVLWKSLSIEKELESSEHAEKVLLTKFIHRHTYELPEPFGKRQLLVFQKEFKTDPRYPRSVGVPKKNPL